MECVQRGSSAMEENDIILSVLCPSLIPALLEALVSVWKERQSSHTKRPVNADQISPVLQGAC